MILVGKLAEEGIELVPGDGAVYIQVNLGKLIGQIIHDGQQWRGVGFNQFHAINHAIAVAVENTEIGFHVGIGHDIAKEFCELVIRDEAINV